MLCIVAVNLSIYLYMRFSLTSNMTAVLEELTMFSGIFCTTMYCANLSSTKPPACPLSVFSWRAMYSSFHNLFIKLLVILWKCAYCSFDSWHSKWQFSISYVAIDPLICLLFGYRTQNRIVSNHELFHTHQLLLMLFSLKTHSQPEVL